MVRPLVLQSNYFLFVQFELFHNMVIRTIPIIPYIRIYVNGEALLIDLHNSNEVEGENSQN